MSADAWSIRASAGRQFALAATVFLVVSGIVMSLIYRTIVSSELDEELLEQVADVRAGEAWEKLDLAAMAEAVRSTTSGELETPLAWRFRRVAAIPPSGRRSEEVIGVPELTALFEPASTGRDLREVWRPTTSTRQVRLAMADGIEADVILDGRDWMQRTWIFAGSFAVVALLGSLLSLLVGRWFGSRVSRMVSGVADEVSRGQQAVDLSAARSTEAPVEVRAVAEAIEGRLQAHRDEIERSRILVAGLAHDLRAPVQALLTSTQVALMEGADAPSDPRATLERHVGELRGLARTVDNIMEWGAPRRPASGDAAVHFDLGAEIRARLVGEEEAAAKAGVFLDRIETGDLRMHGSPDSIVLAIRNLVGNALAWSPSGSEVSVTLEGSKEAVTVRVEDEGPGVPKADRERIFEAFVRGKAAPGRRAGYGLGLAIVRAVAERHGGSIHVEERVEAGEKSDGGTTGACFVLRLPRDGHP